LYDKVIFYYLLVTTNRKVYILEVPRKQNMAKNYSVRTDGYRQLEMRFDKPTLPPQERNGQLEEILNHSTIPQFLKEAKPFLDYPHPQKVPEILFDYFPGQFGRRQILDSGELLKLKTIIRAVYETYSKQVGFLQEAIPYSLDDVYLRENTAEKEELMREHLGKRVQAKIMKYGGSPDYGTRIGELFREQVLHYQKLISKGNRRN